MAFQDRAFDTLALRNGSFAFNARFRKIIRVAVEFVGTATGNSFNVPAGISTTGSIIQRCLDDEFLEAVRSRHRNIRRRIRSDRIGVYPVDSNAVARCSLAID